MKLGSSWGPCSSWGPWQLLGSLAAPGVPGSPWGPWQLLGDTTVTCRGWLSPPVLSQVDFLGDIMMKARKRPIKRRKRRSSPGDFRLCEQPWSP